MSITNIYCDESCHLQHDRQPLMALGAVWGPAERARDISASLREIRARHRLSLQMEIKWGKVSPAGLPFYSDLVNFFFYESALSYRCVVALKGNLDHARFEQDHDTW